MTELEPRWRTFQGEIDPKQIGVYGGHCNRTACREPGARYWNTVTRAHYCEVCAMLINRANDPPICELAREEVKGDGH